MKLFKMLYLMEARKNPEINTRKTAMDALFDIRQDIIKNNENIDDYFVSFMQVNKTGINVQSQYNTPVGLYCYPFRYIVGRAAGTTNSLDIRPFPTNHVDYIKVYKITKKHNIVNMEDKVDPNILRKYKQYFEDFNPTDAMTYQELWNYVYRENIGIDSGINMRRKNSAQTATSIFRKLGIDGFIDNGTGTIHGNEPVQAVFFNTTCLTTIDVIRETSTELFFANIKNKVVSKHELIQPINTLLGNLRFNTIGEGIRNLFKIIKQNNFLEDTEPSSLWYVFCELFIHFFTINRDFSKYDESVLREFYTWFDEILNKLTETQHTAIIDKLVKDSPETCFHIVCSQKISAILTNRVHLFVNKLLNTDDFSYQFLCFLGDLAWFHDRRILNFKKTFNKETVKYLLDKVVEKNTNTEQFQIILDELKRVQILLVDEYKEYISRLNR